MIDSSTLDRCRRRLQEEAGILAVWGLGSAFGDRMRPDSDVDLAVLYEEGHSEDFARVGGLSLDLESIFGRTVDLGRLSTRNLVYAFQAISRGTLLYSRDADAVNRFAGRVFSLYSDFKQDRKVVEDAYLAG